MVTGSLARTNSALTRQLDHASGEDISFLHCGGDDLGVPVIFVISTATKGDYMLQKHSCSLALRVVRSYGYYF